jgi:hypothetical protein
VTLSGVRAAISTRLNIEPGMTLNWIDLPHGSFRTRLITVRPIFTPSPRSLLSGLIQYNAADHTLTSSVRLRWEYIPGSEFFVVYSDGRDTAESTGMPLMNRTFAVKITRLLRF